MRSSLRTLHPFLLAAPVLAAALVTTGFLRAQSAAPLPAAPDTATEIDYTGSLLGYYRMEANERDGSTASQSAPALQPVQRFLEFRDTGGGKGKLLLGMGDNFGPEFGASLQLENYGDAGCKQDPKDTGDNESRPESLYKDDDRVALKARCDNVLNFLMQAGFRAVVPGSQDFMYTARWLRDSALLLEKAGSDPEQVPLIRNGDRKLELLGANLRMSGKGRPGGAPPGGSGSSKGGGMRCPLLFSPQPFDDNTVRCVGDGTQPEPLDWLDRLDRLSRGSGANPEVDAVQQLVTDPFFRAKGQQSELDALVGDEISIMASAWGQRFKELNSLLSSVRTRQAQSQGLDDQEVAGLAQNLDHLSYCQAADSDPDRKDMCTYASVLSRILKNRNEFVAQGQKQAQPGAGTTGGGETRINGSDLVLTEAARKAAIFGLLRTIAIEERNVGYTVATTDSSRKVLVIGVVGQSTMQAVSATNLRLCPVEQDSQTGNSKDEHLFGRCADRTRAGPGGNGFTVLVTDPVRVAQALVRGADLVDGPFDSVVLMAQMPHTEAEVLSQRVSRRLRLAAAQRPFHLVDIVLSEADSSYASAHLTLNFPGSAQGTYAAPVLTPLNSYSSTTARYSYPGAVSNLTFAWAADGGFSLTNRPDGIFTPPTIEQPPDVTSGQSAPADQSCPGAGSVQVPKGAETTIQLLFERMCAEPLYEQMVKGANAGSDLASGLQKPDPASANQRAEFALLQDLQKSRRPRPDVVLLQSRDVFLDAMGPGYSDYTMCRPENEGDARTLCELRVALDRIFWKGDYVEYLAVTGKSLKAILAQSEQKMAEQAELADTGYTREWLISYGLVQSALSNITAVSRNNEPQWIPADPMCKSDSASQTTYCVGGTPIADDAYYWLLTTDQLAQDKAVYTGTLQSLPPDQHETTGIFITAPLSQYLLSVLKHNQQIAALNPSAGVAGNPSPARPAGNPAVEKSENPPVENVVAYNNQLFQQRRLFQVDFSKVIASFTSRQPIGGNQFVADFQGVSEPRATATSQQELDLEAASRITENMFGPTGTGKALPPMSLGVQSSFAYDRSVLGNLTPSTRPINASYALNNVAAGGFLQVRLNARTGRSGIAAVRSLPRDLLVFSPRQYQVQINHQYLFFPFANSSPVPGELTVTLPRTVIWTDRAGFRREFGQNRPGSFFWAGSYLETGLELSEQENVLSSLTLQTGANQKTCTVSASVTLQSCFSQKPSLVINNTTTVAGLPGVKTLHTPGVYWQLHLQNFIYGKGPNKQISLVTDVTGADYYFGRPPGAELPTQTEYAIPLSLSLVIPAMGNLTFAPTYSAFFYQPEVSSQSLQVNSFSIAARWYFARDARVPVRRQARLPGPASADQTKTGKAH